MTLWCACPLAMIGMTKMTDNQRDLECDDDEQRFKDRLGELVKAKPEKPD